MTLLTDRLIYIIGTNKLQNALMASFLERETGAKCVAVENFHEIQVMNNENIVQPRLVLWDCLEKDLKACLSEIESNVKRILPQDFITLFNVSSCLGIEREAIAMGVRGFFYKQDPPGHFPKGVCAIFNGELWVPREILTESILKVKGRATFLAAYEKGLTHREVEILAMLAGGATNQKIADKLYISPHTVKTHIYNIFKKLDVPNRFQAALWAAKNL